MVLVGTDEASNGGAGAVGTDEEGRPQGSAGGLDADDPAGRFDQSGHGGARPNLNPGGRGCVEQDRVERDPADVDDRGSEQAGNAADLDPRLVEGDDARVDWRSLLKDPVQETQLL